VRKTYRPVVEYHRVMFNLADDTAIEGILWDERGELLVIRDAILHDQRRGGPKPLDGEVVLERRRLAFAQVLR
jgi:hypothetical protein